MKAKNKPQTREKVITVWCVIRRQKYSEDESVERAYAARSMARNVARNRRVDSVNYDFVIRPAKLVVKLKGAR